MLTEQEIAQLDWQKTGDLLPVIVQHAVSGDVLMLGYMNREALDKTISEKRVTFYSRTKQRLWTKGESSGHFLNLEDLFKDCDNDTLLALVTPIGPTCHQGTNSCFAPAQTAQGFLYELESVIKSRKTADRTALTQHNSMPPVPNGLPRKWARKAWKPHWPPLSAIKRN